MAETIVNSEKQLVLVQPDVVARDPAANFANVARLLDGVEIAPGALIVLPETFAVGFGSYLGEVAEPEHDGATSCFLSSLAKKRGAFVLGGAVVLDSDGRLKNRALVFSPGGEPLAFYDKLQPFALGASGEPCVAGDAITVFDWDGITVAPFICYDLRFPEWFRAAARASRPELFVVIASWPATRAHHRTRLLAARAIENQAFVAAVNRVGTDPNGLSHTGESQILDFHGERIVDAGPNEAVVCHTLDFSPLAEYRASLPFLDDMRSDFWDARAGGP